MSSNHTISEKIYAGKLRSSVGRKGPVTDDPPVLKLSTGLVLFPAKLMGSKIHIAVDTGSFHTVVALNCLKKTNHIYPTSVVLEGASGPITPVGGTKIRFFFRRMVVE